MTPYSFTVEAEIVVVYIEFCRFKFKYIQYPSNGLT